MIWVKDRIIKIRDLMGEDTPESLTYAALESRIAIEQVCYDRLRIAHDYISHDDIRKWQPKDVVNTLIQEVDDKIASTFTLSMSKEPAHSQKGALSQQDFEKLQYQKIGTQVGFDPKKLGKLWNALSSFLHVKLPKSKVDRINAYGEKLQLKRKIEEVLVELDLIAKGTLTMGGFGETVSFECYCGSLNKRRVSLLKENQIINCINPGCPEQWEAIFNNDDIEFERKKIGVECRSCAEQIFFPLKAMLELKLNKTANFSCAKCKEVNFVAWRLMQAK